MLANQLHTPAINKHSLFEDAQGIFTGCLFVASGVMVFRQIGLVTGGTTGIAFLMHYMTGQPLGWILFLINLPFYLFAWFKLGKVFTLKTFFAVSLLAVFVEWLPHWIEFGNIDPVFAAVLAGLLAGTGILMLIRHGASLGGVTITAIYLQKERGWSAGKVQMAVDAAILLVAFNVVDLHKVLLSLLGAAALNFVIGVNHRHGRYFGV